MDFRPTPDQAALMAALERMVEPFAAAPTDFRRFTLEREELEAQLEAAEFFDIAQTPGLGPVAAALAVERLARLPCTAEVALSMLVRPHLRSGRWPRPLSFVERGRPARFLTRAKTALVADGESLGAAFLSRGNAAAVDSLFAYPMGALDTDVAVKALEPEEGAEVRRWLRVALAAEAAGLMQAGIDSTVEHLSVRQQFGRPLGTFQALRHRLSECAVLAGGVKWLALEAAGTRDAGAAALAAFHAQQSAARVTYDLHQMLGAMGVTLEHPLHLWTYRLKALQSELGGHGAQAQAVAQLCFP